MPKIPIEEYNKKVALVASLDRERMPFWQYWRDLADYLLPSRYVWLQTGSEQRLSRRNSMILDSTGTVAARVLASGMMNGITSPSRPWFKLRIKGISMEDYPVLAEWTDEVTRIILQSMAETNFYNAMGLMYLDLSVFGTANTIIYESVDKPYHCYNSALGEFYLMQDAEHKVNGMARKFQYTVRQLVTEFGVENCSDRVKTAWAAGGARLNEQISVIHLIEPNDGSGEYRTVGRQFRYRECYWEEGGGNPGMLLRERGYFEYPAISPRWELTANDVYGTAPGMDALPDVIQLQHETKKKAQGLDKLVSPPLLADVMLEHRPMALLPNGVTFVPRLTDNAGARPLYTVNPPLGEMSQDIAQVQARIREIFHNDLFTMISQLETVRSATEIDARREEKLILLGPVLERFENEALDPAIKRIFSIHQRRGDFPEFPPGFDNVKLEIQYVSILSAAQSAVGTAPTERLLQLIGNVAGIWPEAKLIPDIPELLNEYALDIGVRQRNLRPREEVKQTIQAMNEQSSQENALAGATQGAEAAKLLSETDVGGGANALQKLLGSVT